MQSYWIESENGQTHIQLRETEQPLPGPNQVLVQLHAAGLNRGELLAGHSLHGNSPQAKPLGSEGAGTIVETGDGVADFKVGERVMGRCQGAFAECALMDVREVMRVPDEMSWEEAAAIPLAYLVAYDMLVVQGALKAREWVLVTGVSSGVGVAVLQLAKVLGAHVVGTSGSTDKLTRLKDLGLDVGLLTREPDFSDAVLQATDSKGANLVINNVGGSLFHECMRSMAYEGRFATVGYVDGQLSSTIDIGLLHAKRLVLFGVSNKLRGPAERASLVQRFTADIVPLFASGRLRPVVDHAYPFTELPTAIRQMESNRHMGKLVIVY
ncbi:quinone oxidoreductase family protein [Allopusillimonas ginsengisoli]|uniref:quinone oxidoreductase family protein n=1 Tax=Allopusillimonas ginsengisoli TaxID=453575 RepID=UPI0010C1CD3E|nr:zinc-binding alcohol dehydrogenase [Allopusillimonas ginsengisoli]